MKIVKKITAVLFVIFMLAGIIASCDSGSPENIPVGGGDQNPGGEDSPQEGSGEPVNEKLLPDLPADADFNGYVFTVLAHKEESDDWITEVPREILAEVENTDDPINDAVYKRNEMLKERYNIDFAVVANNYGEEHTVLSKAVKAGDDIYDAVIMFNNNVPTVVNGGLLTNVANLPYVDLGKPWWDPAVNSMSIDNKNYLLGGDMLILDNEATNALVFNKELMATLGMELPYNTVKEGKWTMDKMDEMIRGAAVDLNGDGKMTPEEDRWGFVCYRDTMHALLVSGGGLLADKNSDDIPYMVFAEPKNLTVLDKVMDIMYNKDDVLNIQSDIADSGTASSNWLRAYHNAFEENRSLFQWVRMRVVEKFRGMEAEFGIIPLPKFDDNQSNYRSVVNPYTGVLLGVPKTAGDLERTSVILEAIAAESRYTLQPAYYDVVLTRKFARDAESEEMLDIIFSSRVYDIGAVYAFGNSFIDLITLCNKSDRNISSYYEKRQGAMEKDINKVITVFETME